MTETTHATTGSLPLLEEQSGGGCGCGGCGCGPTDGRSAPTPAATNPAEEGEPMATHSYAVSGMTCGHCASAVTGELEALDGVTDVRVALVPDGTSTVTVVSSIPLEDAQVAAALAEAGDYRLA